MAKTAVFNILITATEGQTPLLHVTLIGWTREKELELRGMILQLLMDAQAVTPGLTLAEILSVGTTGSEVILEPSEDSGREG